MTPEQRREQAENGVVMEEKTDVPKLADVLDDARVKVCIGLEQQGHIPTVERMLAEGKTWEEIGEVIGWYGPTAEEWYGLYLKAREGSQAPPADALSLAADGLAEAAKLALEYVADPSKNPFAVASRCETESEGVPMSEKKEQSAETEMYICEISHLILHPNQPYIFRVHPDCKGCKDYLGVEHPAASPSDDEHITEQHRNAGRICSACDDYWSDDPEFGIATSCDHIRAASPSQLSARELAYGFACSLVDEGLIRAADCPEVTERLEAFRDASQRQPSVIGFTGNEELDAEMCRCGHTRGKHDPEDGLCDGGPPCSPRCRAFVPQSVSEEQLQKAADKIVFYLAQLHNAGMLSYVKPPTIISILKSAFKEEL